MIKKSKSPASLRAIFPCLLLSVIFSFAQISWVPHVIHDNTHGTSSVYACDVDGDDDLDVLGAVLEDNDMVWWRNEGGNPIIWTKLAISYNFAQAFSVYAADLDDDGDQDVIGAAGAGDEIAWWSNDSGTGIHWTKYTIRSGYDFAHEVYAYDLDEDGDMDVFGASSNHDLISWWRNEGGNPVQWTEQTIGANFDGAKSVRVGDIDGDGDNDVAGASIWGNEITWWRNDGGSPIQWTEFNIDSTFYGAHRVQIVDIDEDDDLDILAVAYLNNEIAWYSNDGGDPVTWTKQTIGYNLLAACIAQAADLDGDGDLDITGTAQTTDEVAWWRNDGGTPIVWTKFYVDEYLDRAWPLYVCDLDEDGDQDVIAASSWAGTNEVNWYENTGTGIFAGQNPIVTSSDNRTLIMRRAETMKINPDCTIYDISGRKIKLDLLSPGIYFLEREDRTTGKIVVVP